MALIAILMTLPACVGTKFLPGNETGLKDISSVAVLVDTSICISSSTTALIDVPENVTMSRTIAGRAREKLIERGYRPTDQESIISVGARYPAHWNFLLKNGDSITYSGREPRQIPPYSIEPETDRSKGTSLLRLFQNLPKDEDTNVPSVLDIGAQSDAVLMIQMQGQVTNLTFDTPRYSFPRAGRDA